MLFERFEESGLSQYSYAVGCRAAGAIAIVDPRRDVDVYVDFARDRNLRISHVLETHIHADFASGARELATVTDAELWLSGYDKGELYEVAFPHRDVHEGDALEIGVARLEAIHTPGHTPEHLSFLAYDTARSRDVPMLLLSGDFLFVGSLGRPDLLGEDAKRGLAAKLFASVTDKLKGLPDGLEIHPGHGAGSMCGAGMSGRPTSTLGFERIANPYLRPGLGREAFVEKILSTVPPFPPYYTRMKRVNAAGPSLLRGIPGLRAIDAQHFRDMVESGHIVVDLRDQLEFGAGHIPGAFGIGASTNLSTWAAWVVPYDIPLLLVASGRPRIEEAARALVRVGLDEIDGYLGRGFQSWIDAGYPVKQMPQISPVELSQRLGSRADIQVLDVRTDEEWNGGHIEGAVHIMGGTLGERLDEIRGDPRPLAVVCGSGYRSTVAASVLERARFVDLLNVTGGMDAWTRAGLPTSRA